MPCIDVLQLCVSIVAALTAAIHTSASGDDTSAGVEYTPDADGTQPRASSSSLEALHAALGASRIAVSGGSIANRGACFSALRAAVQAHAPCVQVLEIQPAQDVRTLGDSTEEVQLPDDVLWVNCAAHETEHAVLRSLITQQPTFAHAHAQVKRARWSTQTSRLSMLFLLPDFHLFLQQSLHASAADGSAVDEQAALLRLIRWWSCPRCFLARLPHEGLVTRTQPSALSVTTDGTPQPAAVDVADCATAAACAPPGPFACAAAAAGGGVSLASAVVMSYGHRHALVREHVLLPPVCAHLQLDGAHAWAANGTQPMPSPSAAAPTWALSATPTVTEAQRTAWLQRVHSSSATDGGCCAGTRASASPLAPGDACTRLVLEGMRLGVPLQAPSPDAGSLPASAYSSLSDKWGARTLERFEFGLHCQIAAEPALGVHPERGPIIQHIEAAASTVSGADTVPAVEQESSAHADSVLWGSGVAGYADTKRSLMRDVMEPVWAHLLHEHGARISRPVSPRSRANVHHILSNSRVSHLAHNMHVMKVRTVRLPLALSGCRSCGSRGQGLILLLPCHS
ncbi:hypothetical protein EON66_04900 [archaeon]|nr:MAG: hypothetical protein EON66_04900 [archaeon]